MNKQNGASLYLTEDMIILPSESLKTFIRDCNVPAEEKPKISQDLSGLKKAVVELLNKYPIEYDRYLQHQFHYEKFRPKHIYFIEIKEIFLNILKNIKQKKCEQEYKIYDLPTTENPPSVFLVKYENDNIIHLGIRETRLFWKKEDESIDTGNNAIKKKTITLIEKPIEICRFYDFNLDDKTGILYIDSVGQGAAFALKDYEEIILNDFNLIFNEKETLLESLLNFSLTIPVLTNYILMPHVFIRKLEKQDSVGCGSQFEITSKEMNKILKIAQEDKIPLIKIKESYPQTDLTLTHTGSIASDEAYAKKKMSYWSETADMNIVYSNKNGKYDSIHISIDAINSFFKTHEYHFEGIVANELSKISDIISKSKIRR